MMVVRRFSGPTRVLLVEDNKVNREKFEEFLSKRGLIVESAGSVSEAKKLIEKTLDDKKLFYSKIFLDLDLSKAENGSIADKIGGLHLMVWCKRKKIESEFFLHSTAFNNKFLKLVNPVAWIGRLLGAKIFSKKTLYETFSK